MKLLYACTQNGIKNIWDWKIIYSHTFVCYIGKLHYHKGLHSFVDVRIFREFILRFSLNYATIQPPWKGTWLLGHSTKKITMWWYVNFDIFLKLFCTIYLPLHGDSVKLTSANGISKCATYSMNITYLSWLTCTYVFFLKKSSFYTFAMLCLNLDPIRTETFTKIGCCTS